jgi:acetoin utilization deacetylase AcuC-like enzyme
MARMQRSQEDEPVDLTTDAVLQASDTPTPRIINGIRTAFFNSALCEGHNIPSHPECVDRVRVVRQRIVADFPAILEVQEIAPISRQRLLLFHTPKHVDAISNIFTSVKSASENSRKKNGGKVHHIDEDTAIAVGSEAAALTAAGSVCEAIDLVMRYTNEENDGSSENSPMMRITNAFCGVRPPGHHAEPHRAMGFCLFNNVGIGACYLLNTFPDVIKRVSIVDFDVHHGNGTQAKFASEDYPNVQYISTHQAPFYPHTGSVHERGVHSNIMNVPLRARTGSTAFRSAFESRVLPAMHAYKPDFVLISAGFDAHVQDPLAELALESDDYYWMTQQIVDVAWKHAQGRVVSVLEGGMLLASCCCYRAFAVVSPR